MELKKLEGGFFVSTKDAIFYRKDFQTGELIESTQEAYASWLNKTRITSTIEWSEWDSNVPEELYESRNGKYYFFLEEGLISLFRENDNDSDQVGFEGAQYQYSLVKDLEQCPKLIGHEETIFALSLLKVDFDWVSKSIDLLGQWQSNPELISYNADNYDLSVMIAEDGRKFVSIKKIRFGTKNSLKSKAKKVESPF